MYYEKFGNELNPIIICLHSTNCVHCFAKQYDYFSKNYCVIIPHLPGFGENGDVTFSTELAVQQIAELAASFGKKVTLMGFSLGAQLCLPLLCKHSECFNGAVMISPWLIKNIAEVEKAMKQWSDNEKLFKSNLYIGLNTFGTGLGKKEKLENAEYCKKVSINTVIASIDNGIELSGYPEFKDVELPMLAICGMKEPTDIRKSVHSLSVQNPRCKYDIWDGASHNIPFRYASRLNKTVEEFIDKKLKP